MNYRAYFQNFTTETEGVVKYYGLTNKEAEDLRRQHKGKVSGSNGNYTVYDKAGAYAIQGKFSLFIEKIEGSYTNVKATTIEDIKYLEFLMGEPTYKIGQSKDTHRLVENRKWILGGVEIPFELGLLGHSDADVVYHCVVESIIGALGLGDIGKLFPDTDIKYKDIDSSYFMKEAYKMMDNLGYEIGNIDITIYIEKPILKQTQKAVETLVTSEIPNMTKHHK